MSSPPKTNAAAKKPRNVKARRIAQLKAELDALLTEASVGRPTLYRPEYAVRATGLCMLGLTNAELGERFGVSEGTIDQWIAEIPEFAGSVYDGREGADIKVLQSAFHAARGYDHEEDDIRTVSLGDNQGSEIVITKTRKHYPPNYNFANLLLINRQRHRYPHRESAAAGGGDSTLSPQEKARAAREAIAAAMREINVPEEGGKEGDS